MLKQLVFKGAADGPVFLVTGAVHGNEKCGTAAIGRLVMEIESGLVSIDKGTLVCVPVCNPRAYSLHKRQAEANLNRVMLRHASPSLYEHHLANALADIIDGCDVMLDLHSYSSGVRPFLFLDSDTPAHRAYAAALGIPFWITGWDDLYAGAQDLNAGDTMTYAKSAGKLGLLVECGQHEDAAAILHGYHALRRALAHFGLTAPYTAAGDTTAPQINRLTKIVTKDKAGHFAKPWQHLDPVRKGETVIFFDDGSTLEAPADGVVIMPAPLAEPGSEWIYFGTADA
ncbi:MAG: succinylglutamate desuccinylase/aspartoacylase family protein [Alphaproteobacteria bacterium]